MAKLAVHYGFTPDQVRRLTLYQFFVVYLGKLEDVSPFYLQLRANQRQAKAQAPAAKPQPMSWNDAVAKIEAIRKRKKAEGLI